jgi:hypothetical protein
VATRIRISNADAPSSLPENAPSSAGLSGNAEAPGKKETNYFYSFFFPIFAA